MSKRSALYDRWRPLLTETLPYEVPVIFTNDFLFASVAEGSAHPELHKAIDNLRRSRFVGSKPYSYEIVKDRFHHTTLGLIHPIQQMSIAKFYESYAETITAQCAGSNFSIRRPGEPTPMFSESQLDSDSLKQGLPHADPREGELDASRVTSYFTYRGYSILARFIDSAEYIRLEKRYSRLRTLDISKCFFNIYTHSLSWAVKGKRIAKRDRTKHSFENAFDELMQHANYNETNGIVIGPEVSRIFAEIILQAVDVEVEKSLSQLDHNVDYAVRRYVDDYFIFSDSEEIIDKIQESIRTSLEKFKLFFNENKIETYARPFVTSITLARRDVRQVFSELSENIDKFDELAEPAEYRRTARHIASKISELRMVVGDYRVGFHTLSGWLIGSLRSVLSRLIRMSNEERGEARLAGLTDATVALFEVIAYVVALDLRVRSTYSLASIAISIEHFASNSDSDHKDRVRHAVHQELSTLIRSAASVYRSSSRTDSVELCNLLITAVHVVGPDVLLDRVVADALDLIINKPDRITYFRYITAKFCLLSRQIPNDPDLAVINSQVQKMLLEAITADKENDGTGEDAELYFLLSDYLSSPDVTHAEMRSVLVGRPAARLSNAQLDALRLHVGFVDWYGFRLENMLVRKQLRPVYSIG